MAKYYKVIYYSLVHYPQEDDDNFVLGYNVFQAENSGMVHEWHKLAPNVVPSFENYVKIYKNHYKPVKSVLMGDNEMEDRGDMGKYPKGDYKYYNTFRLEYADVGTKIDDWKKIIILTNKKLEEIILKRAIKMQHESEYKVAVKRSREKVETVEKEQKERLKPAKRKRDESLVEYEKIFS